MGMYGINDLIDPEHAFVRAVMASNNAYDDFADGFGWKTLALDYKTSPFLLEKACQQYAQRVGKPWPPRPLKEYNLKPKFNKIPKTLTANNLAKSAYKAHLKRVETKVYYIYKAYASGIKTNHLAFKYKIKHAEMRKILSHYAKSMGLIFPLTYQQRLKPRLNGKLK